MSVTPLSALFFEPERLLALVEDLGGRPYHAKILREQVLGAGVLDYDEMTSLPARLRADLAASHPILCATELGRTCSRDKTTKLLLGFPRRRANESASEDSSEDASAGANANEDEDASGDGDETEAHDAVETVHIPSHKGNKGATLCISTQVGCPVACPFCASGRAGLVRNLEAHEILEQFLTGRAIGPVARSVVMGIGEPLLNFKATSAALRLVHAEFGLGARKITLSTVGFPDRLRAAADEAPPFQLAISLHTPFDAERDVLVPAMKGTPIEDILNAGDYWFDATGREITYEYVLLGGENDTPDHAEALADRLAGRRCMVNLIPFNPVDESGYARPTTEAVEGFHADLEHAGLVATVRWSRGMESDAACGQLRLRAAPNRNRTE